MSVARRTLVLLVNGATGGSANMIPDRTAPPKQKSMELNQQANGLALETCRAPLEKEQTQKYVRQKSAFGTNWDTIFSYNLS